MFRIGQSKDTHKFILDKELKLGGINIPYSKGLLAHSDGDVVLHVVAESIIGALGLGDLGTLFPDNDEKYKNIDSSYFVIEVVKLMKNEKYHINNIDITIFLEEPHLKDYKGLMKKNISTLLDTLPKNVNIKATRGEALGYIGRKEGIDATCVVLLEKDKDY